tara:strand:- start:1352 stop:1774 length:423 start_codon:yes stop_codon:yes gene_type:complete
MTRTFDSSTETMNDADTYHGIDLAWNVEREFGRDHPDDITAVGFRTTGNYFETIDAIRAIAHSAASIPFLARSHAQQIAFWVNLEINEDRLEKGDLDLDDDWAPDSVTESDFLLLLQSIIEGDDGAADFLTENHMIDYED